MNGVKGTAQGRQGKNPLVQGFLLSGRTVLDYDNEVEKILSMLDVDSIRVRITVFDKLQRITIDRCNIIYYSLYITII